MNVIFTDIDGVLNPHWKSKWSKNAISIYNRLCYEFNLLPVITSTWRLNHSKEELQRIFTEQGISSTIYDYTIHLEQQDRGLEIENWLSNNKFDFYVVIDDRVSNIEPYVNNVVKCNSWEGLTINEYNKIKEIYENRR